MVKTVDVVYPYVVDGEVAGPVGFVVLGLVLEAEELAGAVGLVWEVVGTLVVE